MTGKELRNLQESYMEMYNPEKIDEAITSEKGKAKAAAMIDARSTPSGRAKPGQGANVATIKHISHSEREGLRGTPMTPTMAKNPAKSRTSSGTGNNAARRAGLTPTREKPNAWKEQVDIFDVVLEFLQAEGYAETLEEAEWMMANVLDEEAVEIILGEAQDATPPKGQSKYGRKAPPGYMQTRKPTLQQMSSREKQAWKNRGIGEEYVDEAQVANRDPEKYEAGEKKKYAPVRGERTPMPPRGDKRREDFEKWYRDNVR